MKISKLITLFIIFGLFSSASIIYFYFLQKSFAQKHKEFINSIDKLENVYEQSTNLVLKNSLYVYTNQDNIAITNKKLYSTYQTLLNSSVLDDSSYSSVKNKLISLEKDLKKHIEDIEYFLMINAGVKNSFLFLSRHIEDGDILKKHDQNELLKAREILKHFDDAKTFQDLDYLENCNYTLKPSSTNSELVYFIESFNLHSKYLYEKYPQFIDITKSILEDEDIDKKINEIKQNFSTVSLNDSDALEKFTYTLFFILFVYVVIIVLLITKLNKENSKLKGISKSLQHSLTYDQLTNLKNRKQFEEDIHKVQNPYLLLLNINDFKSINDVYGNDYGNILLQNLSELLNTKMQTLSDATLYRLGGDEFGILLDTTDTQNVHNIAESLEDCISKHHFKIEDVDIFLKVSIAINNQKPILENASLTIKHIKRTSDIDIHEYKESEYSKQDIKENMHTIEIVKEALADGRIIPFYQPIINLQTSKIEKYEALVRLKQKDGTFLPPFKFLDISKKSSLYHKITNTMVEQVIKTAREYPKYRFSINISMIDIKNRKIMENLFKLFDENKDVASRIDIELLESENLEDIQLVKSFIDKLKEYDSQILIDDFGTGYSNFSYFADLDVNVIKIDGSIVKEILTNEKKLHMFKSIKNFAKGMSMKTVSEFVETKEIAQTLRELGTTYAQGYYFSAPLEKPLDDDVVVI